MPSHYLNQFWDIIDWVFRNKTQWNCNRTPYIVIANASENPVRKIAAILSRPQCVKPRIKAPYTRKRTTLEKTYIAKSCLSTANPGWRLCNQGVIWQLVNGWADFFSTGISHWNVIFQQTIIACPRNIVSLKAVCAQPMTTGVTTYLVGWAQVYSISQEICTRFCCALLCCGYVIVHNEFK